MLLDGAKNRYDDPPPSFQAAMGETAHPVPSQPHPDRISHPLPSSPRDVQDPFINPSEEPSLTSPQRWSTSPLSSPPTSHIGTTMSRSQHTQSSSGNPFHHAEGSMSNIALIQSSSNAPELRGSLNRQQRQQSLHPHPHSNANIDLEAHGDSSEKEKTPSKLPSPMGAWRSIGLGMLLLLTTPLFITGFIILSFGTIINAVGLILTGIGNAIKWPHVRVQERFNLEQT